jgi:hypothetical protein
MNEVTDQRREQLQLYEKNDGVSCPFQNIYCQRNCRLYDSNNDLCDFTMIRNSLAVLTDMFADFLKVYEKK